MRRDRPTPVAREELTRHLLLAFERYCPGNTHRLTALPVAMRPFPVVDGPLRLVDVALPGWGADCGVEGIIAVPRECCDGPQANSWEDVDWWLAAFLLLEGWHERVWERTHGPIHSYAFRLGEWDQRAWGHAWVNRIALFLRAWAAHEARADEMRLFGPLPSAEIVITHDVDAVAKTWAIRCKQSVFLAFNALRALVSGRLVLAGARLGRAITFFFSPGDWRTVKLVCELEGERGLRSQFNFYADSRSKSPRRWLFDPGYDVASPRLARLVQELAQAGWSIGLHPSFDAWRTREQLRRQRERLQSVAPTAVTACRQHWLRFSWQETWSAQAAAGLLQDTTLMFNDRPGFRAAAALEWSPWDGERGAAHGLRELPTVFMDSHFYDYQPMGAEKRRAAMRHWLDEVTAVGGRIAVLWHPHTLTSDYGWADGFQDLLDMLKGKASC